MIVKDSVHVLTSDHPTIHRLPLKCFVLPSSKTYRKTMKMAGMERGMARRPMVVIIMCINSRSKDEERF